MAQKRPLVRNTCQAVAHCHVVLHSAATSSACYGNPEARLTAKLCESRALTCRAAVQ